MSAAEPAEGHSLVELLVAVAVMGVVALGVAELLARISGESSSAQKRQGVQNDLQLLGMALQKFMASGDIRFFAYLGGSGAVPPRVVSRVLIPQPGRCRNLATAGCADQTAFLYIHYDKTTTPAVSTICALPPSGPPGERLIVVDGNDDSYGAATFSPATGAFTIAGGQVGIAPGKLLAIMDPPKAVLWVALAKPVPFTVNQTPAGARTYGGTSLPLPSECDSHLRDGVLPLKKVDKLYTVRARPFVLTQFTGGAAVTDAEIGSSWGRFPMRIFVATLRSLGAMPLPPPGRFEAGYGDCAINPASLAVTCGGPALLRVFPVDRVRMDQAFHVSLFKGAATLPADRFELLSGGMPVSNACASPGCEKLPVPPDGSIPDVIDAAETYDALRSSGFSLIKQETVSILRVRLMMDAAKFKEEAVDVRFP